MRLGIYKDEHGWIHLQDSESEEELERIEGYIDISGSFWAEFQQAWVDWDSVQKRLQMLYDNKQDE